MKYLDNYARLLVKAGINIQKGQPLVINSPIECAYFARTISDIAFDEGAGDVIINWIDEKFNRIKFLKAPESVFETFPNYRREMYMETMNANAGYLSISASDPEIMKGVDANRMATFNKVASMALAPYREKMMSHQLSWCVASIPTAAWAKKVFPDVSEEVAIEKLWEAIYKVTRADQADPVAAWEEHKTNLKSKIKFLNEQNFKFLHLESELGTDLMVELPIGHKWQGGSDKTLEGVEYLANVPTEEVFTMPHRAGVNGKVYSSMPFNYNGNLIEDMQFTFKDGLVVDFDASTAKDVLEGLLNTDEGAKRLGEIALVPYDSPISNLGILFYNTLYDENASCHLALGKAYPTCLEGASGLKEDELMAKGANHSLTHQDFMIGTKDMTITGIKENGEKVPVFIKGNWA